MSKLEDLILKKIEKGHYKVSRENLEKNVDYKLVSVPSLAIVFICPFIFVLILSKFFNFNTNTFLILIVFSFISGSYNVYKIINNLFSKANNRNKNV